MCKLGITISLIFTTPVLTFFKSNIPVGSLEPNTDTRAIVVRDLTAIRIELRVSGLGLYSWKSTTSLINVSTVAVLTSIAWVMLLNDYVFF